MPNVYPARIVIRTIDEIVNRHNQLVDLLGKDLTTVVSGGGVGDVKSPIVPGVIDDTVVLYDGISGKRIKASAIYASWFDQDVSTDANVTFDSVDTHQAIVTAYSDTDTALDVISESTDYAESTFIKDATGTIERYGLSDGNPDVLISSADLETGITTLSGLVVTGDITVGDYTLPEDLDGFVTADIISDEEYGEDWEADTTHAPTKNAIYDKIESMGGGLSENDAIAYAVALG